MIVVMYWLVVLGEKIVRSLKVKFLHLKQTLI